MWIMADGIRTIKTGTGEKLNTTNFLTMNFKEEKP
jgi:hypothetical protein